MAGHDAYGSTFWALASRFKQHDHESHSRAQAFSTTQSSLSKTNSQTSQEERQSSEHRRRPSFVSPGNSSHTFPCPSCHLRRRTSTASSSGSSIQSHQPQQQHLKHTVNDEGFGHFCPDIPLPNEVNSPHYSQRHQQHRRRHSSLYHGELTDKVAGAFPPSDDSSPSDSLASVESSRDHLTKCHCGSIRPVENLEERYGLVEGRTT